MSLTHFNWLSKHLANSAKKLTFLLTALSKEDTKAILNYVHTWVKILDIRRAAEGPIILQWDRRSLKESPGLNARIQTVLNTLYFWLSTSDQELSQSKYLQWNIRQAANGYNSEAITIKVELVYIHNTK